MKLIVIYQLLLYAEGIALLGENINTTDPKRNIESMLDLSKKDCLKINAENNMHTS
jgi:hypothetical protein